MQARHENFRRATAVDGGPLYLHLYLYSFFIVIARARVRAVRA